MLDKIINEAIKNGGATLTATLDNAKLKYNYMVSLYGHEATFKVDDMEGLKEGLKAYQKKATGKKDLYIGLWVNDGLVYLDLSVNICKKPDNSFGNSFEHQQINLPNKPIPQSKAAR